MFDLHPGRAAAPDLVVTRPSDMGDVEGWRALAASIAGCSYFATPDWVLGWWETLGEGRTGEVAVWRDAAGAVDAVVGLTLERERLHPRFPGSVRTWVNLGSGEGSADHCAWPIAPARVEDVRAWIGAKAARLPVILKDLDPGSGVVALPDAARRVYDTPCPRLTIPTDGKSVGSSGFRKTLRQYARKMAAERIGFRWVGPEEIEPGLIDTLLDLHRRRREHKGATTGFTSRRVSFLRALLQRSGPQRGPAAVVAERDDEIVGVLFGFLWQGTFSHYQGGWDPTFARDGLGTMLCAEAIDLCRAAGVTTYDFLRGEEWYKYRFGAVDLFDETWVVPTGLTGRLLALKYKTKTKLEAEASSERRRPPA